MPKKICFTPEAWEDFLELYAGDKSKIRKIISLITDIQRNGFFLHGHFIHIGKSYSRGRLIKQTTAFPTAY